jgi:hypothetical protein
MKYIIYITLFFYIISCNNNTKQVNQAKVDSTTAKIAASTTTFDIPTIIDSGKAFFKVNIYKSNKLFTTYEGNWAIAAFDGDNFNIQFSASQRMLKIAHYLVLYFNGAAMGTFPVVASGNEKGKPTLIFTPEVNGNYGIGISADTGIVNITKYSQQTVSGTIDAKGKDENGEEIIIKTAFVNIKNNNLEQ